METIAMHSGRIPRTLDKLFSEAPRLVLTPGKKFVIMSDFHMGNGSRTDDFTRNADLVSTVLQRFYRERGYTLILNGDIEEVQRFPLRHIIATWPDLYRLFNEFHAAGRLYKLVGNHDIDLLFMNKLYPYPVHQALTITHGKNSLFLLHGHQSSHFFHHFNWFSGLTLRFLANPLGIRNFSVAHDNKYRFLTEKRFYQFSRRQKIITIIGHTHRPLFESLSKKDSLKMTIERLCRSYTRAAGADKRTIEDKLSRCKGEFVSLMSKRGPTGPGDGIYADGLTIPCLFNSGCAVGKRGITAIELSGNDISLVHWFDSRVSRRHFSPNGTAPVKLPGTDVFKKTLKRDSLHYIFTRINLLS
jgi:UDP-2,3-diacylglucosamine pyrophosphatase LpxH